MKKLIPWRRLIILVLAIIFITVLTGALEREGAYHPLPFLAGLGIALFVLFVMMIKFVYDD